MRTLFYGLLLAFIWKGAIRLGHLEAEKKVARATEQVFRDTLADLFIRFPDVVMAQMMHETKDFTSDIYKENHNCVGMKWNNRGYAKGVNRGHARYDNVWDCLHDYADWQAKYCPKYIKTDEEYIDWLMKFGYAEDPLYKKLVTRTLTIVKR